MKKLFILRHAQTHPADHSGDRERKLTPKGIEDARALGHVMKERNYVPGFVLCSPATRTRQTLDYVSESLGKISTEYVKGIYEGGYQDLMELVRGVDDKYDALLVVGHNPSIHQFAASLARDDGGMMVGRLHSGYAPGTLTVLEAGAARWAGVKVGENVLVNLVDAT